jgi:SAM-dependent methyltransferase
MGTSSPADAAPERVEAMFAAGGVLEDWSAGAQAMALLEAVHDAGWLRFLVEPRDLTALVGFTGLAASQVEDVLDALAAHGIVGRDAGLVRLTPAFALLSADDAPSDLAERLAYRAILPRLVRDAATTAPGDPLSGEDALILAKGVAGRVSPVSRALFRGLVDLLPGYQVLAEGGRLLDVGCGIGWAMLNLATLYPAARQVGIELIPEVAAETERRARALGVQDRVEVRCQDAQTYDAEETFDTAFWAQPFFPEPTRAGTLKMIWRALKPGGVLIMQELFVHPEDDDEAAVREFALTRLLYQHWGVRFAPSAEHLADEAAAGGFELDRIASTPLGRLVLMRRPAQT